MKYGNTKLNYSTAFMLKRKIAPVLMAIQLALPVSLLSAHSPAYAVSNALKKDLARMEIKFFDHDYKKEPVEKRIERVEKLVYGESKTGSEDDRLSALVAAVPDLSSVKSTPETPGDSQEPSQGSKNKTRTSEDSTSPDPSTDYPRVDAIEQVMLGKTYKDEALGKRLDQLELKAYKKVSSDPDLSKRVEHLEKYVRKHYHKSVSQMVDPRSNSGAGEAPTRTAYSPPAYTGYSGGSGSYGMNPPSMPPSRYGNSYSQAAPADRPPSLGAPISEQLVWLEQHVYGRTYPKKSLIDRVRALERTVFPSDPPDTATSIPMQIKVLVNAVELMHKSPKQSNQANQSNNQTANQSGSNFPNWPQAGGGSSYGGYASQNDLSTGQYGAGNSYQNAYQNQAGGYSQPAYNQSYQAPATSTAQTRQPTQQPTQKRGHPLLKSLAKTLLTVGAVAAGSVLGGGYYGGGYGSPYGYGSRGYGGAYGMNGAYGTGYGSGYRRGVYF